MNPLELASRRYATKKFDTNRRIPQEKIEELKRVLHLSPSSINIQPWKFHFVQDPKIKSRLAGASLHNTEKINQADLLIVFSVADDLSAFQSVVDNNLPQMLRDWYNVAKAATPEPELKVWLSKQVYIALGIGLSTAAALGLDSTPMEGIESDKYREILDLSDYKPIMALAVGYAAEDDPYKPDAMPKSRRAFEEVVVSL